MLNTKASLKWKIAQTLEYKWWQNYLKKKNTAEYLSWKETYWNNLLAEIAAFLPLLKGNKILDAGCGPAGIFMALNEFAEPSNLNVTPKQAAATNIQQVFGLVKTSKHVSLEDMEQAIAAGKNRHVVD